MITIKELLNRIRWDPQEHPEEYALFYHDRIKDWLEEIAFAEIKRIEDNFMILFKEGKEINIPLHRIRKVKKKGELVWER